MIMTLFDHDTDAELTELSWISNPGNQVLRVKLGFSPKNQGGG